MYSQKLYTIIVYGGKAKQIKAALNAVNALFVAEILPYNSVFVAYLLLISQHFEFSLVFFVHQGRHRAVFAVALGKLAGETLILSA